jgi:hypothetical protein
MSQDDFDVKTMSREELEAELETRRDEYAAVSKVLDEAGVLEVIETADGTGVWCSLAKRVQLLVERNADQFAALHADFDKAERLSFATLFQFPSGKHIVCFFSGEVKTPGWYVFDNQHDRILAADGTWTSDKDGWGPQHRFETADAAFEAMEDAHWAESADEAKKEDDGRRVTLDELMPVCLHCGQREGQHRAPDRRCFTYVTGMRDTAETSFTPRRAEQRFGIWITAEHWYTIVDGGPDLVGDREAIAAVVRNARVHADLMISGERQDYYYEVRPYTGSDPASDEELKVFWAECEKASSGGSK